MHQLRKNWKTKVIIEEIEKDVSVGEENKRDSLHQASVKSEGGKLKQKRRFARLSGSALVDLTKSN